MTEEKIYSHKDIVVWQKGMRLVIEIYKLTETFPREELYGLTAQIRRSAVSIPSNIAEGRHRGTRKDFVQFLRIAYGSCAELQTQIEIAKQLLKTSDVRYETIEALLVEIMKMLHAMIRKLKANS